MLRSILLAPALLASALFATLPIQPAMAQKGGGTWSKAGDWLITMDPGDNCAMIESFSGDWLFGLGYSADRRAIAMVVGKLPYKVGDSPALAWEIGNDSYTGGGNVVAKVEAGTRITAPMNSDFVDKLAAATLIEIYDEDTEEKLVGFNLTNTAAGIAELRRCLGELIKEDKGSRQPPTTAAKPRNLATLITADDYPSTAQRAGAAGRTGVALTITAHGLVSDCSIMGSSGNADLDNATCRIMRARARFTPATDATSKPTEGRFETGVTWNLPAD